MHETREDFTRVGEEARGDGNATLTFPTNIRDDVFDLEEGGKGAPTANGP